ncbi:OsmC family protein [Actinotalea fermentans]|uniref:Osmotically inducible protein C n=1 Tax=Actinotalea fermentans TaxID=43671 RepID=A0A511Z1K8_9CELL|nr:OsmC family protein [Actinotalea fermentans]KGM14892.1 oxidoreductase [Actinotalea fermentans ATCC 43279 = JCM 9966 = DSM 3133]GEN81347.1 osmotically inducible protein C [Actinotalea fermentans]
MSDTHRWVEIERVEPGVFRARNARGGELHVAGDGGELFTPVELLMVAIAACSAADVDVITSRRAEPEELRARVDAHKVRDETGNSLRDIQVTFTARFAEGEAGDAARAALPRAVQTSHDRSCTVSRTVEAGTPVQVLLA